MLSKIGQGANKNAANCKQETARGKKSIGPIIFGEAGMPPVQPRAFPLASE